MAQNPTASHRRYQSAVDLSGFLSDVTLGVSMKPNDSARPKPHHFLTPPLKRKRQRLGSETSTSFTAGCTKSTKSMGIIGILKAKFDRATRAKGNPSTNDVTGAIMTEPIEIDDVPMVCDVASDLYASPQLASLMENEPAEGSLVADCGAPAAAISSNTEQRMEKAAQNETVEQESPKPTVSLSGGPYRLHILLKQGRELAAKDTCGTSDPYVKFKLGNKVVHRSKTVYRDLNPVWDEDFYVNIEDVTIPLQIRVFDYDWWVQDDFLGFSTIDLSQLDLNKSKDIVLELQNGDCEKSEGFIDIRATLTPKTINEVDMDHMKNVSKYYDQARKLKVQIWSSVVNILVIECKELGYKDGEHPNKPYLRLRLSNEKYKTKSVAWSPTIKTVTFLEQFDFHLYEDQSHLLEISLCDKEPRGKDDLIGKAVLDLAGLEGELTHSLGCNFQDGGIGSVSLLVTKSGTTASETISDLPTSNLKPSTKELETIQKRYSLMRTLHNLRDVGHLTVKVFRAKGLVAADIGGKSDPFCVLQLVNSRLQTQTEYKTLTPIWNKIFTFNVKDINAVLEVTVYDEDRNHQVEFLGKLAIPLLRIRDSERRWYALKDNKLRARAKGNHPQILLELSVIWNALRASMQTLVPKENKYIEPEVKFNRQTFTRNVMRLKSVIEDVFEFSKYIQSCFEWESPGRSTIAFVLFLVVTWYFQPFFMPMFFLIYFLRSFLKRSFTATPANDYDSDGSTEDDDVENDEKNKEEHKSIKEKLRIIQEVTLSVQNSIGHLASLLESIKNTFNYSVPFLSYLAIFLLVAACVLLYFIPIRVLILGWGINKFTRKLLRPHSIPNNELFDFLSRVPDDEKLIQYRELLLEPRVLPRRPSRRH